MRRLIGDVILTVLAPLLAIALMAQAMAQAPLLGFPPGMFSGRNVPAGAPPAYTGPGDVIGANWKFWYGFRAFSSADRGNRLANVCNSTGGVDVACVDMNSDASTGLFVLTTVSGVACVANCTIKTWYDRSGTSCTGSVACDLTQATIANRPVLVPSCLNGNACLSCLNTSTQQMTSVATLPVQAQPYTISAIAERTSNNSAVNAIIGSGLGADASVGFNNNASQSYFQAGTTVQVISVNDNVVHAFGYVFNGASSIYNIDTATATVNPGTNGWPNSSAVAPTLCSHNGVGGSLMAGDIWEAGMNKASLSAGNLVSLNTNLHAAYGGF